MTALEPVGVRQWPGEHGGMVWAGPIAEVRAELERATAAGRITRRSALQPVPGRPGVVAVRVHLVEPQPARVITGRPVRPAAPWWARWAAIGGGALLTLGAVAWVLVEVLHALALLVPILLGVAVVLLVAWLILRATGGGGGSSGGGSLGGIYISQNIRIGR